jgi:cobalamin synthase
MIQALIGPIAELAGGWLKGKADAQAATANLKLVEAEAKATIMKSAATSEADWERLMAQGSQNSWKDEWLTILFSIPLILAFLPFEWADQAVTNGFAALERMPSWYSYTLGVIVAASFGVRSATKFFGGKK